MSVDHLDRAVLTALVRIVGRPGATGILYEHRMGDFAEEGVEPATARAVLHSLQARELVERQHETNLVPNPRYRRPTTPPAFAAMQRVTEMYAPQGEPEFLERRGQAVWQLTKSGSAVVASLGAPLRAAATAQEAAAGTKVVPAADRFVALDDNQAEVLKAREAVEEVLATAREANELTATPEDRLAVIREVEGLSALLKGSSVRAAALWQATRESGVLRWLATECASAYVQAAALAALGALGLLAAKLLGSG